MQENEKRKKRTDGKPTKVGLKEAGKEQRQILGQVSLRDTSNTRVGASGKMQSTQQKKVLQPSNFNDENHNPNLAQTVEKKEKSKSWINVPVDFLKSKMRPSTKQPNLKNENDNAQKRRANKNSKAGLSQQAGPKTPSRKAKQEVELLESPFKSPIPDDSDQHYLHYTEQKKTDSYYAQKRHILDNFRQWISKVTGDEVGGRQWRIHENGNDDPWSRLCINTASNFCDRNQGEAYQSPRAFACGIKQCCSLATRREGVSMVFLRNPKQEHKAGKKTRYAFYRTSEFGVKPIEFVSKVLPKSMEDTCTEIERIYATAEFDGRENKSLVMNVGFLNLVNQYDPKQTKNIAVITANGIYSNEEAQKQMERVRGVIHDITPNIDVHIIPKGDMPMVRRTGTLEHCETVFADLVQGVYRDDESVWEDVIRGSPWCVDVSPKIASRENRLGGLPKMLFSDQKVDLSLDNEKLSPPLSRMHSSSEGNESEIGRTDHEDNSSDDSDRENKNPN